MRECRHSSRKTGNSLRKLLLEKFLLHKKTQLDKKIKDKQNVQYTYKRNVFYTIILKRILKFTSLCWSCCFLNELINKDKVLPAIRGTHRFITHTLIKPAQTVV